MMDPTRLSGALVHAWARPDAAQSVLNEKLSRESAPFAPIAEGIGLWPMFLNEPERFGPSEGVPSNELTAETVAQGLAVAFKGR